ncbi:MAG TPA: hypothetical protein VGE66_08425 [Chitinophagaceae bacterium]
MAKLTSLLRFNGSLDGITVYRLPGVSDPVARTTWGPSKEDLQRKPQYAQTRRNLSESCGRGKATSWLMKAFQPLKPLADFDTAGQLNRLLRAVQKGDTESPWGERAVRLSRFPHLPEGFRLTKVLPFDSVVRGEVGVRMDRDTLSATVELPELRPRLTFFPPPGFAYCRLLVTLGVAPDVIHGPQGWGTDGDYTKCFAQAAYTDWFAAAKGSGATTLQLQLPYTPPSESFALVLAVGMQLGEPGLTGGVETVRGRVGSARILAVGGRT